LFFLILIKMKAEDLKLKHLGDILSTDIDHLKLMKEIFGYRETFINKIFKFKKIFFKLNNLINDISSMPKSNLVLSKEKISIKIPEDVDRIPYIAMLELQSFISNIPEDYDFQKIIQEVVSIYAFKANYKTHDFDKSSWTFDIFRNSIQDESAVQMIALYNLILKQIKDSSTHWNNQFLNVEVHDQDMVNAGAERSKPFNVVKTIKNTCRDFNEDYKSSVQLPYIIIQTSSLDRATDAKIQDDLRIIKEDKMKANRKQ